MNSRKLEIEGSMVTANAKALLADVPKTDTDGVGLKLAVLVIAAFVVAHIAGVFWFPLTAGWTVAGVAAGVALVLVLTWLYVGLFIVAHDCMHGTIAPKTPWINRRLGQLCLTIYAGFDFDKVIVKHFEHHDHPGTGADPDYLEAHPHGFIPWYLKFFSEYFSLRSVLIILAQSTIYQLAFGVSLANIMVFWTLPALLSSLQLFTFGTYLPHRPGADGFADGHHARSNSYPVWLSLLTCFHFGYHHEHHLAPWAPWWRLPRVRQATAGRD